MPITQDDIKNYSTYSYADTSTYLEQCEFSDLTGKTLTDVQVFNTDADHQIIFETMEGEKYKMFHDQDCCESVSIEDIVGDVTKLVRSPVLVARESTSDDTSGKGFKYPDNSYVDESGTWTFYIIGTNKEIVTIRWWGTSNGYYSESVGFYKIVN